jgi:hypothetical protein
MSVDRNEKIWSYTATGTVMHAFVQSAGGGRVRALCRPSITRDKSLLFLGLDASRQPFACASCLKRARYMWNRAEASMAPVDTHENPTASQDYYGAVADESAVIEALNCPAVMDALHNEALAMDREYDERQPARKALMFLAGSVYGAAAEAVGHRPETQDARLTTRERASVSTDADGSISGSFSAMKKLYDSGLAEVDPETGDLVWAS